MDLKANLTKAQTTVKTSDMKLKHNAEALKKAKQEMKKTDSEYNRDSQNLKKYETEVEKLCKELGQDFYYYLKIVLFRIILNYTNYVLGNIKYEDGSYENLEEDVRNKKHEYNATKTQVNTMSARYPWLDFQYSDPEPNFDRSQVYGVAAKLFKIKNNKFTVALDTAGGGKVSNKSVILHMIFMLKN